MDDITKKETLPGDIKIIVEVVKYGHDQQKQILKFKNVTELPVTKWDSYRLTSIRILCDLTNVKDANHLIGFLRYHQYCLGVGSDLKDIIY